MKWKKWLEHWDMTSLKITTPFLEMEWQPQEADKRAAWELYIELLTRVSTQTLPDTYGDEKTALNSIYSLFQITREIIKENGRECVEFTKIAIIVLNQVIRPFTAKWHTLSIKSGFEDETTRREFRVELEGLQKTLRNYTKALADMAGVEDLTSLERG